MFLAGTLAQLMVFPALSMGLGLLQVFIAGCIDMSETFQVQMKF